MQDNEIPTGLVFTRFRKRWERYAPEICIYDLPHLKINIYSFVDQFEELLDRIVNRQKAILSSEIFKNTDKRFAIIFDENDMKELLFLMIGKDSALLVDLEIYIFVESPKKELFPACQKIQTSKEH